MLPSKHRLKKENDFACTLKGRSRIQGDGLSLKMRENGSDEARFGVIISKKVDKKAVERNRIHRVIAETLRDHLREIKTGVDVVFIVGPELREQESASIKEATERLLKKAELT